MRSDLRYVDVVWIHGKALVSLNVMCACSLKGTNANTCLCNACTGSETVYLRVSTFVFRPDDPQGWSSIILFYYVDFRGLLGHAMQNQF
jgi:hypothetical protein